LQQQGPHTTRRAVVGWAQCGGRVAGEADRVAFAVASGGQRARWVNAAWSVSEPGKAAMPTAAAAATATARTVS
jgi:hypothetical protein